MMTRSYKELSRLKTLKQRYDYLRLGAIVGESTFGFTRQVNQAFYHSSDWRDVRDQVILRDDGCDLGVPGYPIRGIIVVHHINPITLDEILGGDPIIVDLDNLICTSRRTHEAIHFSNESLLPKPLVKRRPGDMIPWKF